jgi:hypothetical protein
LDVREQPLRPLVVLGGDDGGFPVRDAYYGLTELVAERGPALLATAVLLTGGRAAGEDLLQAARR